MYEHFYTVSYNVIKNRAPPKMGYAKLFPYSYLKLLINCALKFNYSFPFPYAFTRLRVLHFSIFALFFARAFTFFVVTNLIFIAIDLTSAHTFHMILHVLHILSAVFRKHFDRPQEHFSRFTFL